MKTICISVDCSCYRGKIKDIESILRWDVLDLLGYIFKFNGLVQDDCFLKIYIDVDGVDGVTMDYLEITNFCFHLVSRMLFNRGYDLIVAPYTDTLPDELQPKESEIH